MIFFLIYYFMALFATMKFASFFEAINSTIFLFCFNFCSLLLEKPNSSLMNCTFFMNGPSKA